MFTLIGIIGLLIISFAIWLKNERRQDILFVVGGILMLVYSISIDSIIFAVLQAVFIASALFEILRLPRK